MSPEEIKRMMNQKALQDMVTEIQEDGKMLLHLEVRMAEEREKKICGKPNDFLVYHYAHQSLEKKMNGQLDMYEEDDYVG